ncbi:hypothetical protein M569_03342 [Genlisea aurea]|uniref:DUF7815 domain-containing protein n=1 Tax=Genlisea aurea TaxID=192259 RepID=S8CX20_9LAMI|nr:hypothetical protein M569_03342 [Genlisea aurea]
MPEKSLELIRLLKNRTRAAAGLSDYSSSSPNVPPLVSDAPPGLLCKNCGGMLLRGHESVICLYCGTNTDREASLKSISFPSSIGYEWLLHSLHLKGSELVEQGSKQVQGQDHLIKEPLCPLSEFLCLKIENHMTVSKRTLSFNGIGADKLMIKSEKNGSSDVLSEGAKVDDLDISGREDFSNCISENRFQNMQLSDTNENSSAQKSELAREEWEADFQSSDIKHLNEASSDHWGGSSIGFGGKLYDFESSIDDSINLVVDHDSLVSDLGNRKDANVEKLSDDAAAYTEFDYWNSDDLLKKISGNTSSIPNTDADVDALGRSFHRQDDDLTFDILNGISSSAASFPHSQSKTTEKDQQYDNDEMVLEDQTDEWNDFMFSNKVESPPRNAYAGEDLGSSDFEKKNGADVNSASEFENAILKSQTFHGSENTDMIFSDSMFGLGKDVTPIGSAPVSTALDSWNSIDTWKNISLSTTENGVGFADVDRRKQDEHILDTLDFSFSDDLFPTLVPQSSNDVENSKTLHQEHDEMIYPNQIDGWNDLSLNTTKAAGGVAVLSRKDDHTSESMQDLSLFESQSTGIPQYMVQHQLNDDNQIEEWNDFMGPTILEDFSKCASGENVHNASEMKIPGELWPDHPPQPQVSVEEPFGISRNFNVGVGPMSNDEKTNPNASSSVFDDWNSSDYIWKKLSLDSKNLDGDDEWNEFMGSNGRNLDALGNDKSSALLVESSNLAWDDEWNEFVGSSSSATAPCQSAHKTERDMAPKPWPQGFNAPPSSSAAPAPSKALLMDYDARQQLQDEAEQLERDVMRKEQETLNVLKQLESMRMFAGELKHQISSSSSPSMLLDQLSHSKSTLDSSSLALSMIQASVDSLNNQKMRLANNNSSTSPPAAEEELMILVNLECEQFKKMKEASRYEFIRAMREIERTKSSIRMAEMRLDAAKKLEEAAKAVEAIVAAEEQPCELFRDKKSKSVVRRTHEEELVTIVGKPRSQAADSDKVIYTHRRTTTTTHGGGEKHSRSSRRKKERGFRSVISIGDILTRKLVLQDDHQHQRSSLSQMLKEQSQLIFHRPKPIPSPSPSPSPSLGGNAEKRGLVLPQLF